MYSNESDEQPKLLFDLHQGELQLSLLVEKEWKPWLFTVLQLSLKSQHAIPISSINLTSINLTSINLTSIMVTSIN